MLLRWVCAQFMGNLRSAMLEILALLSMRPAGIFASVLCHSFYVLSPPLFCNFAYFPPDHLVCRFLAKQYGLTKDTIANGLPLIDTTATLVAQYCPSFLMTPQCKIERCGANLRSLSEITVDFFPGTVLPRVHATTWRTQTGRWQWMVITGMPPNTTNSAWPGHFLSISTVVPVTHLWRSSQWMRVF